MGEGFEKAAADREKIRSEMGEGFARAAADREKIRFEMGEGFEKAAADREKIRSEMKEGFTKAERHREKLKDELLANRQEWSAVHEVRIQNLEKTAMGVLPYSSDDPSPSPRSSPSSTRRQQAGVQRTKRRAATTAKGP